MTSCLTISGTLSSPNAHNTFVILLEPSELVFYNHLSPQWSFRIRDSRAAATATKPKRPVKFKDDPKSQVVQIYEATFDPTAGSTSGATPDLDPSSTVEYHAPKRDSIFCF